MSNPIETGFKIYLNSVITGMGMGTGVAIIAIILRKFFAIGLCG